MILYFSPLACSMATRIAFYEAGVDAAYVQVDTKKKRTETGVDFLTINPLGQVPALATDDGLTITENAAILQYVADRFPAARLAPPPESAERVRLHQWLCFIGTELHKSLFVALLDAKAPADARAYALEKETSRLGLLEAHLAGREFLLERYSVADAYLVTILNWSAVTPVNLSRFPAVKAYAARLRSRPAIARAFAVEIALYEKERTRELRT
jgi:glutathione S-transferase